MIINGNYQCKHSIILNPASMRELDSFLLAKYETVSYAAELKDKSSVEFLNADEMSLDSEDQIASLDDFSVDTILQGSREAVQALHVETAEPAPEATVQSDAKSDEEM